MPFPHNAGRPTIILAAIDTLVVLLDKGNVEQRVVRVDEPAYSSGTANEVAMST